MIAVSTVTEVSVFVTKSSSLQIVSLFIATPSPQDVPFLFHFHIHNPRLKVFSFLFRSTSDFFLLPLLSHN